DEPSVVTEEVDADASNQEWPVRVVHRPAGTWRPGEDVEHDTLGRGWVWGSGLGVVTVRFETRLTGVGPVRSLPGDDPALHRADLLPMAYEVPDDGGPLSDDPDPAPADE
ncbi:MAG: hypothetical protein FWF75_07820, partial [Propionibacteriaceae bacterium]|nr:hypothetical protein [Propionibacteriaceae bacterium]